ncbi:MAG: hypothetical protein B6245_10385 [Desulfobacteraceae bacterium 4572_88]|nr:MAG: hypothetical protein B6245_10385 [Desulfobacteraceae bacterium 4572_88]
MLVSSDPAWNALTHQCQGAETRKFRLPAYGTQGVGMGKGFFGKPGHLTARRRGISPQNSGDTLLILIITDFWEAAN